MLRAQQRIGIGADGVEGDVAEVEQTREADDDVEPPTQHHVGQDQHAEIHRLLVGEGRERQQHRCRQQQPAEPFGAGPGDRLPRGRACRFVHRTVGPGPDGADHEQHAAQRHEPVQEARRQLHRRGAGRDHHRPQRHRGPAQAVRRHRQAETPQEDHDDRHREIDELIVEGEATTDIDGTEADDEDAERRADEGGQARILQHLGQARIHAVRPSRSPVCRAVRSAGRSAPGPGSRRRRHPCTRWKNNPPRRPRSGR